MSLLKSVVLLDIVKIVSSNHYSPLHLLALDYPRQNSPSYAHIPGKGTLLVNVRALSGLQTWLSYNTQEAKPESPQDTQGINPISSGVLEQ